MPIASKPIAFVVAILDPNIVVVATVVSFATT
jgi:hypothetical protein